MKIPKSVYSVKHNIVFVVGLAVFVMLFAVIYTPGYGVENQTGLGLWYDHQGICLPICCAIILVSTSLSRLLLLLTTRTARIYETEYLLWQAAEVAVAGLFCTLFLSLYLHVDYFNLLPTVLLIYFSVALFPYTFYWLLVERMDRDQRIANAQRALMELRRNGGDDERTIRFADDKGNVKLIVSTDRVISIESAGNYVNILYENNGKLVRFSLRNTLKGIEELCDSYSLVRCHRSYFINLHKVKLLRKESDGVFAEIAAEGVEDIPVSKSYAADVMQRFASRLACLLLFLLPFGASACAQDNLYNPVDSLRVTDAEWSVDSLDGFVVKNYHFGEGTLFCSAQHLFVIEIPKQSPRHLAFVRDTALTEVSTLAERCGAMAAINGSYFDMNQGNPICYLRINGQECGENTPQKNDSLNRKYYQHATLSLRKGRPRLTVPDSNRCWETSMKDSNIMTAGPMLLRRGNLVPQRDDRSFVTHRHNRTALGIRPDGTTLLVVADGRFKNHAEGLSLPELELVMRWLGCREAINLDGGGSSTMYVKGHGIVNYPSDNNRHDHEGERPVSNAIVIL